MSDPLKKVKSGDKFAPQSRTWNRFIDATRLVESQQATSDGPASGAYPTAQLIHIKNASGFDVAQHGVLGISGSLYSPTDNEAQFRNEVLLTGVTPTSAHAGKFVVLREPIQNGKIGLAYINGCFPAKINVVASGDLLADVEDGNATRLISGSGSAQIIYKPSGTGDKFAIVRIGGSASGGGTATRLKIISTDSTDGRYNVADGSPYSSGTAYAINLLEASSSYTFSGHILDGSTDPLWTLGWDSGVRDGGKIVYYIQHRQIACT